MPVIHFLSNEAKYTLSYKILICPFSSLHVKINVCPGDDLQRFYPSEADVRLERVGRSKLIQTNFTEPYVEFYKHNSLSFRSSHEKFDVSGLGLRQFHELF